MQDRDSRWSVGFTKPYCKQSSMPGGCDSGAAFKGLHVAAGCGFTVQKLVLIRSVPSLSLLAQTFV